MIRLKEIRDIALRDAKNLILCNVDEMQTAYDYSMRIVTGARKEGILAIENMLCFVKRDHFQAENFCWMMLMVVDGTDTDLMEELMTGKFYANGYTGIEALIYYLYARVAFSVQAGEHPRVVEDFFNSMIPDELSPKHQVDHRFFNEQHLLFNSLQMESLKEIRSCLSNTELDLLERFESKLSTLNEEEWWEVTNQNGFYGWDILVPVVSEKCRLLMDAHMAYGRVKRMLDYARMHKEGTYEEAFKEFDLFIERIRNSNQDTTENEKLEILLTVEDNELQRIIRNLDETKLAMAMKLCSDNLKHRILRKVGIRKRHEITGLMDYIGPVRLRDAQEATDNIVAYIEQREISTINPIKKNWL